MLFLNTLYGVKNSKYLILSQSQREKVGIGGT
jgi:hypothetical protein